MSSFYLSIGHITEDLLPDGGTTPGGTVSYAAITARNLGQRAAILTAAPAYMRSLPTFHDIEIAGPATERATMFENIYTPHGRVQYVRAVAPIITPADVPPDWGRDAQIVHLGPVAQECSFDLIDCFPDALIGVTPQGWMRTWDSTDGKVQPIIWENSEQVLRRVSALVLSEEDLPEGEYGESLLKSYIEHCPIVALTQGYRGCTIYWEGRSEHVPAYRAREIDPTGAGDVFACAFFIRLYSTRDPISAARFANAAAGINIERPGISGAPTLEEVEERMHTEPI